jgi:hypothetical protein
VLAMEVIEKSGRRGNRGCRITLRYFAFSFQRLFFLRVVLIAFSSLLLLLDLFFCTKVFDRNAAQFSNVAREFVVTNGIVREKYEV